jgi:hypothetical protein
LIGLLCNNKKERTRHSDDDNDDITAVNHLPIDDDSIVTIHHGAAFDNNIWLRFVRLRELNGYDEQYLVSLDEKNVLPFIKTTELLARVTTFVDPVEYRQQPYHLNNKVEKIPSTHELCVHTKELIRNLTIGDRVTILLHLRRLMFGDVIPCELCCPLCKEMISLAVRVSNLLLQPANSLPKTEKFIEINNFSLKIRPLNGSDQEAMLLLAKDSVTSSQQYTEYIVRSCIVSSKPSIPEILSNEFIAKVSSSLEELDPQANILLNMKCPSCKQFFQTPFFAEDFIFQEMSARHVRLEHEIHCLAFYYHWDERDILSLASKRRKKYVELITRSLSGEEWV